MHRLRIVLGVFALSIFPEVTLIAQETQPSNSRSAVIDSSKVLDEWSMQPGVNPLTISSTLLEVVEDVHRDTRNTNYENVMDNSTPRGLRIVKSIGFGILGSGAGFGLGSLTVQITGHPHGEDAGLALLAGGAIGAPILLPIGVHLGNDCRGNLALDYLPLVGTGAGALLLAGKAHDASPFIMLGIVDFAATILIEQLVGH